MQPTADVVIVGGGINGAATAYYLAKLGIRSVVVVEASVPGAGASSRGMGLLRTYHANEPEAALALWSLRVYRNWADEVGGTCGFVNSGFLYLAPPSDLSDLQHNVAMMNRLGGNTQILTQHDVKRLQPHMEVEDIGAAAYEPDCGYAYGALATDGYHVAARRLGVQLRTYCRVVDIVVQSDAVTGVTLEDGTTISSNVVLLAAGPWTAQLATTANVDLPIEPRRLTIGRAYLPPTIERPCAFLDAVVDTSFKPDGDGMALLSMRDDRYGQVIEPDNLIDDVDHVAVVRGLEKIKKRIPAMHDSVPGRTWTGVDGFTPDYKGLYGNVDGYTGLFVCAGASEKGFKVAPAVGKAMADLISTGKSEAIDISAFSPDRFAGITSAAAFNQAMSVEQLL